jgi:DNA-binding LacI/PurR family transcriptional regulator
MSAKPRTKTAQDAGKKRIPRGESAARKAKAVTLSAVAREAGLSVGAVSSFFSGKLYEAGGSSIGLGEESKRRIVEAARKLGYEPSDARLLRKVYPDRGGLMFLIEQRIKEGPAHPYFGGILNGAMREAASRGGHVICSTFDAERDYLLDPAAQPAWLRSGSTARIVMTGGVNYSLVMAAIQAGATVVACSRPVPLNGVVSVLPDYREAARLAVSHLIGLGHRRIACLTDLHLRPGSYNRVELIRGAADAMSAAGLPAPTEEDLVTPKEFFAWREPLRALLARRERPTGIFALDDWTGVQVIRTLIELGVSVPNDVSVIGCNHENRAPGQRPDLSTVHFPLEEIGARAVALAARDFDETTPHRQEILPVYLVPRESCAAPAR